MTLPEPPNVHMPGRKEIVLLPEDDAAYFDLLSEAFPDIRFLNKPYYLPKGTRPMAKTARTFAECPRTHGRIFIVFDPSWTPTWKSEERDDRCIWVLTGPIPYPNGEYECSAGVWSFGQVPASETEAAEYIPDGRLYFRYLAGNEADAIISAFEALADRVGAQRAEIKGEAEDKIKAALDAFAADFA